MTIFAIAGLVLLIALAVLQVALIAGARLGQYVWGGQHTVLPRSLRIGSAVAILLYAVFAAFLLSKAGIVSLVDDTVLTIGMWVITVYIVLSVLPNAISRSKKERAVMTPVSLVLAASFLVVALTG